MKIYSVPGLPGYEGYKGGGIVLTEVILFCDMEDEEGDVIVIELGKKLTEEQYREVVESVAAFLNTRWPHFSANEFAN